VTIQTQLAIGVVDDDDLKGVVFAVFGQDVAAFAVKVVFLIVKGSVAGLTVRVAEAVGFRIRRARRRRRRRLRRRHRRLRDGLANRELGRIPTTVFATVEPLFGRRLEFRVTRKVADGDLSVFGQVLLDGSVCRRRRTVAVLRQELASRTASTRRTRTFVLPHARAAVLAVVRFAIACSSLKGRYRVF